VIAQDPKNVSRRQVLAWALWDWGTSAFSVLITTFVFARYLTSSYFIDPTVASAYQAAGGAAAASGAVKEAFDTAIAGLTSRVGWGLAIGGLSVALLAPVVGQRTDSGGRRKLWLGLNTGIVIALMLSMFFIKGQPGYFLPGVILLTLANIFYEMAGVNYNAMLVQISTPQTMGRVSGFGWGMGYVGGIVVLMLALFGFIQGDGPYWLGVTRQDGMNVRVIAVLAALWALVFAIPVFLAVPENRASDPQTRLGLVGSYRRLFARIAELYREARPTFYFLVASAVFRDGLAGVFAFGGILAGTVFGMAEDEILVFAIASNLVAGTGVFLSGILDDRFGPKRVIVGSLVGLIVAGLALFACHEGGAQAFWVGGLAMTFFVGPAQASARAFLGRLAPEGREGEIFGLYATTGRAVSFLTPAAFALLVGLFGGAWGGILGIVAVLGTGLVLLLPLRAEFVR